MIGSKRERDKSSIESCNENNSSSGSEKYIISSKKILAIKICATKARLKLLRFQNFQQRITGIFQQKPSLRAKIPAIIYDFSVFQFLQPV